MLGLRFFIARVADIRHHKSNDQEQPHVSDIRIKLADKRGKSSEAQ